MNGEAERGWHGMKAVMQNIPRTIFRDHGCT
jgi:hypothetical protein